MSEPTWQYFAWQGEIYECEVLHYVERGPVQFAVVRPSPTQHKWLPRAERETGFVAIPAHVVRRSRLEASCDIGLARLKKIADRT